MKTIILLLQFFTRIPISVQIEWNERKFVNGLVLFPFIGLLIGGISAGFFTLFSGIDLPYLAMISAIVVPVLITGGLHCDGVADTADGFFSGKAREKMLEIMRDSRIGAHGTVALILLFGLKGSAILSLEHPLISLILSAIFARVSMVILAAISTYARSDGGLGEMVISQTKPVQAVGATLVAILICGALFWNLWELILAGTVTSLFGAIFMNRFSVAKIGGTTGDVLGAQIEIMEVVLLVIFAIMGKMV